MWLGYNGDGAEPRLQFRLWADLQCHLGGGLLICENSLPLLTSAHHKAVLCRLAAEKMKTGG